MKILVKLLITVAWLGAISIGWAFALKAMNMPNTMFFAIGVCGVIILFYLLALLERLWKPELRTLWQKIKKEFKNA